MCRFSLEEMTRRVMQERGCSFHAARREMGRRGAMRRAALRRQRVKSGEVYAATARRMGEREVGDE